MLESVSKDPLSEKTPGEIVKYLAEGGLLTDTPETAAKLVTTILPTKGQYHEIVFLGSEICVRTHCRDFEAGRVPLTLGGVFLLMANLEQFITRCMLWIAQGGNNGF